MKCTVTKILCFSKNRPVLNYRVSSIYIFDSGVTFGIKNGNETTETMIPAKRLYKDLEGCCISSYAGWTSSIDCLVCSDGILFKNVLGSLFPSKNVDALFDELVKNYDDILRDVSMQDFNTKDGLSSIIEMLAI